MKSGMRNRDLQDALAELPDDRIVKIALPADGSGGGADTKFAGVEVGESEWHVPAGAGSVCSVVVTLSPIESE